MPNYFTCEEVASMYKVKTLTVWDWIRREKLSAIKIGRDYRIRQKDLNDFERSRATIPQQIRKKQEVLTEEVKPCHYHE